MWGGGGGAFGMGAWERGQQWRWCSAKSGGSSVKGPSADVMGGEGREKKTPCGPKTITFPA